MVTCLIGNETENLATQVGFELAHVYCLSHREPALLTIILLRVCVILAGTELSTN